MGSKTINNPRILFFRFALAAFLIRALIPVGFMPAPVSNGWPIVLCPTGLSDASIQTLLALHAHHSSGESGSNSEYSELCPLGMQLGAAFLPVETLSLSVHLVARVVITPSTTTGMARHFFSYLSRAPPSSIRC